MLQYRNYTALTFRTVQLSSQISYQKNGHQSLTGYIGYITFNKYFQSTYSFSTLIKSKIIRKTSKRNKTKELSNQCQITHKVFSNRFLGILGNYCTNYSNKCFCNLHETAHFKALPSRFDLVWLYSTLPSKTKAINIRLAVFRIIMRLT